MTVTTRAFVIAGSAAALALIPATGAFAESEPVKTSTECSLPPEPTVEHVEE